MKGTCANNSLGKQIGFHPKKVLFSLGRIAFLIGKSYFLTKGVIGNVGIPSEGKIWASTKSIWILKREITSPPGISGNSKHSLWGKVEFLQLPWNNLPFPIEAGIFSQEKWHHFIRQLKFFSRGCGFLENDSTP